MKRLAQEQAKAQKRAKPKKGKASSKGKPNALQIPGQRGHNDLASPGSARTYRSSLKASK